MMSWVPGTHPHLLHERISVLEGAVQSPITSGWLGSGLRPTTLFRIHCLYVHTVGLVSKPSKAHIWAPGTSHYGREQSVANEVSLQVQGTHHLVSMVHVVRAGGGGPGADTQNGGRAGWKHVSSFLLL